MQAFIGKLEDSLLGTKKGQGIPRAYQGLSLSESILSTTLKPLQTHLQNKTKHSLFFSKFLWEQFYKSSRRVHRH